MTHTHTVIQAEHTSDNPVRTARRIITHSLDGVTCFPSVRSNILNLSQYVLQHYNTSSKHTPCNATKPDRSSDTLLSLGLVNYVQSVRTLN